MTTGAAILSEVERSLSEVEGILSLSLALLGMISKDAGPGRRR
jgi:hypothetical protein